MTWPHLNFCDKTVNRFFSLALSETAKLVLNLKNLQRLTLNFNWETKQMHFIIVPEKIETLCPLIAQIAPSYRTQRNRATSDAENF